MKDYRIKGLTPEGKAKSKKYRARDESQALIYAKRDGIIVSTIEEVLLTPEQLLVVRQENEKMLRQMLLGGTVCPYCGRNIPVPSDKYPDWQYLIELDHMDSKSCGGWDHPDNLLYCCRPFNQKKINLLFKDWLLLLDDACRASARDLYIEKHCYQPEDFIPFDFETTFREEELDHREERLSAEWYPHDENGFSWTRWFLVYGI